MPIDLLEENEIKQPTDLLEDTEPFTSSGELLAGLGLGAAALAGGAYFIKPRIAFKKAEKPLIEMQKALQLEGTPLEFIPEYLSTKKADIKTMGARELADLTSEANFSKLSLEAAKNELTNASATLQNQLNNLDNFLGPKLTEDLSKTIKTKSLPFFKDATRAYGKGLLGIEKYFEETGKTIDTLSLQKNFFNKIKTKAIDRTILPENMAVVTQVENMFTPETIAGKFGRELAPEKNVSFVQVKKAVSEIINSSPNTPLSAIVQDEWLNYLKELSKDSPELLKKVSKLDANYKTFKDMQAALLKLSNLGPEKHWTGEFNIKDLDEVMLKYFKDRHNQGIVDIMDYLSEGAEIGEEVLKPMPETKLKWSNFNRMLEDRFKLQENIQRLGEKEKGMGGEIEKLKTTTSKTKRVVVQVLRGKIDAVEELAKKYDILAARLKTAGIKVPLKMGSIRTVLKGLARVGMGARKIVGVTPSILSAVGLGMLDPTFKVLEAQASPFTPEGRARQKKIKEAFDKPDEERTKEEKDLLVSYGLII